MANFVTLGENGGNHLQMSNGLTSVFIDVLTLAGSKLARTDDEKRLIVWLAEKDQNIVGMGTVGFDIREMPWNTGNLEDNKQFIQNVVEAANNKSDWDKLDYQPNEELLFPALEKFSKMIEKLTAEDVYPNAIADWVNAAEKDDPILNGFPKCEKHGILLTCFGCIFCGANL